MLHCLLLFSASFCAAEDVKKIHPSGYVSDLAGVIAPEARTRLEALCAEVEQKTGAQMAIVTVQSLDGEGVENYAVDLFKQLGVGSKKDNRGVLLLVAPHEHKYRIEVGYGLEPVINDARTGDAGRAMVPFLRQGAYGKAAGRRLAVGQAHCGRFGSNAKRSASRGTDSKHRGSRRESGTLVRARFDRALFGDRQPVFPRRWSARRRIGRKRLALVSAGNARGQRWKAFGRRLGRLGRRRFRRRR